MLALPMGLRLNSAKSFAEYSCQRIRLRGDVNCPRDENLRKGVRASVCQDNGTLTGAPESSHAAVSETLVMAGNGVADARICPTCTAPTTFTSSEALYIPGVGERVEVAGLNGGFTVVAVNLGSQSADLVPLRGTEFLLRDVSFAALRPFRKEVPPETS
jgi:hypothetical protein